MAMGVPVWDQFLVTSGLDQAPLHFKVSDNIMRRFAGNAFHLAVSGTIIGYVLAFMEDVAIEDGDDGVAPGPGPGPEASAGSRGVCAHKK